MIVPIIRLSPGSIATIAWRIRRRSRCARSVSDTNGGSSETTGLCSSISATSSSAAWRSVSTIVTRSSPGP